jgi:hypothetical protein
LLLRYSYVAPSLVAGQGEYHESRVLAGRWPLGEQNWSRHIWDRMLNHKRNGFKNGKGKVEKKNKWKHGITMVACAP